MKLHPLALMAAFAVGLAYMLLTTPRPKVIVKFPTPDRAGMDVFRTPNGSCYKVDVDEIACPKDGVRAQPVSDHEEQRP